MLCTLSPHSPHSIIAHFYSDHDSSIINTNDSISSGPSPGLRVSEIQRVRVKSNDQLHNTEERSKSQENIVTLGMGACHSSGSAGGGAEASEGGAAGAGAELLVA